MPEEGVATCSRLWPCRSDTSLPRRPTPLRKILRSWPLGEQREFFGDLLGAPLVLETETGKLFPASNRARDVRDALVAAVRDAGAQIWFDAKVTDVRPTDQDTWTVHLQGAEPLEARAVVLATGGLSVPATGSEGAGLRWAERMGHTMHETYPALTPLTADPPVHAALAGVSLTTTVRQAPSPTGKRAGTKTDGTENNQDQEGSDPPAVPNHRRIPLSPTVATAARRSSTPPT